MGKGFGRIQKRRQRLEADKDPLRALNEMVPWEVFRPDLEQLGHKERKSNAGHKAIDPLVLFKFMPQNLAVGQLLESCSDLAIDLTLA